MSQRRHLYHYTDADGMQGIQDSGAIYSGDKGNSSHARFGNKVYWTDQPPQAGRSDIMRNNYGRGDSYNRPGVYGKTEYYVRARMVDLPNARRVDDGSGRSIYVSDDVNLDGVRHSTGRVKRDN